MADLYGGPGLENQIKVITGDILDKKFERFQGEISKRFDDLEESIEKREQRLVDDIMIRIKPIVGEFKDKAVSESNEATVKLIERLLNVNIGDNDQVSDFQAIIGHAKDQLRESKAARITAKEIFVSRIVTGTCVVIALGIGVLLANLHKFFSEFGSFFLN